MSPVPQALPQQAQATLSPALPSPPFKVLQRATLIKAFTSWMKANQFRIGLVPEDLDLSRTKKDAKLLVNAIRELVADGQGFFLVSGGGDLNKIVQATAPLLPLADIVGVRYELLKGQQLVHYPYLALTWAGSGGTLSSINLVYLTDKNGGYKGTYASKDRA